jgi:hypothetical protein
MKHFRAQVLLVTTLAVGALACNPSGTTGDGEGEADALVCLSPNMPEAPAGTEVPQEMIDACVGKQSGEACTWVFFGSESTGACGSQDGLPIAEGEGEGEGEEPVGEGEGEGDPPPLVGTLYEGMSEAGVVCNDTTCGDGLPCCAVFGGAAEDATCGEQPDICVGAVGMAITLICDGPEDCTDPAAPVCCGGIQFAGTGCTTEAVCDADPQNTQLCVTADDCSAGEDCCSGGIIAMIGGEAGNCQAPTPAGRCARMGPGGM